MPNDVSWCSTPQTNPKSVRQFCGPNPFWTHQKGNAFWTPKWPWIWRTILMGEVTMVTTNSAISTPALLQTISFFSSIFIRPSSSHIVSNCVSSAKSFGWRRLYCQAGGGGTDSLIHWKHENLQPANFKDYSHSRHHSKFPAQSAGWSHSSKSCSQQKHNLQSESQTLGWSN